MVIIYFIISATILFIVFRLLYSMPKAPSQHQRNYEGYFMQASERIASINDAKYLNAAQRVRIEFEQMFSNQPTIKRDSELLQLQIDGKKRKYGEGRWL